MGAVKGAADGLIGGVSSENGLTIFRRSPRLKVLGAGSGGIEELQALLDDREVQWALLRFEVGSGAFLRHKYMFLHMNGAHCPALARGKANALTVDAQRLLRGTDGGAGFHGYHASVEVTLNEEVTMEQLHRRLDRFFIADDLGDHSVQWKVAQAERKHSVNLEGATPRSTWPLAEARRAFKCPGHAALATFASGREALQAVGDPHHGSWNWALVEPTGSNSDLQLVDGGSRSIDEMKASLPSHTEEVLFGLLRLSFGLGRLRRTKFVFVQSTGTAVPAVKRGRLIAARPRMEKAMAEFAQYSVSMEITDPDDLQLEEVIKRMRQAAVIDDEDVGGDVAGKQVYSVESFREALHEEAVQKEIEETLPPMTRRVSRPPAEMRVEEVVGLIHGEGVLDWALFGPADKLAIPPQRSRTLDEFLTPLKDSDDLGVAEIPNPLEAVGGG